MNTEFKSTIIHKDQNTKGRFKDHDTLIIESYDKFSLGSNFSTMRFTENDDYNKVITPSLYSQESNIIKELDTKLNDNDKMILYCTGSSFKVDKSFLYLDFHKYDNIIPGYSTAITILEKAQGNEGTYGEIVSTIGNYFFMSNSDRRDNTLNIIVWLISYGLPTDEIISHITNNLTIEHQLTLDNLCNPHIRPAFTLLDKDKYNTLEKWEKTLFYTVAKAFSNNGRTYTSNLSYLAAYFINALYEYKKTHQDTTNLIEIIDDNNYDYTYGQREKEKITTLINTVTNEDTVTKTEKESIRTHQKNIIDYHLEREIYVENHSIPLAAQLMHTEEKINGFIPPIEIIMNIINK